MTKHFEVDPNVFFDTFLPLTSAIESKYFQQLDAVKVLRKLKSDIYLDKIPFSDFKVFEKVMQCLPINSQLQISNSSAIRYAQLIDIDPSISEIAN